MPFDNKCTDTCVLFKCGEKTHLKKHGSIKMSYKTYDKEVLHKPPSPKVVTKDYSFEINCDHDKNTIIDLEENKSNNCCCCCNDK